MTAFLMSHDSGSKALVYWDSIDFCINNAIMGVGRRTPMPRLKGSADLLEDRRKRALALLDSGHSLNEVGRRIRCHASSVMRWRGDRRRGGATALWGRFSLGHPRQLCDTQA